MTKTIKKKGLSSEQVLASRAKYGENILTPAKRRSLWMRFMDKFKDPLIVILIVAGFASLGIAFYEYFGLNEPWNAFAEPLGILIAILLSTVLSFVFEVKADKEFSILNQVNDDEQVIVIRDGRHQRIRKRDVVVGDLVVIQAGDEIPADGTLCKAVMLRMDESTLTGEPSCMKSTDPASLSKDSTYPSNQVLRGTKVLDGHGEYVVDAVGDLTEYGHVYQNAQIDNGVRTPLNEQLDKLGHLISVASYILAFLIIVGRVLEYIITYSDSLNWAHAVAYFLQSIMIAVTIIVVAVPEGLPMAVTLSLAYSMRRMLKTNNLVRKMHACETMGAATVICTDKTGTLTQNRMSVQEMDLICDSIPEERLFENIALNSTAIVEKSELGHSGPEVIGNPTEGALILWLQQEKVIDYKELRESWERAEEVSFTTEKKYMATVASNPEDGKRYVYLKGAPEIIYKYCKPVVDEDALRAKLNSYQNKAMRVLGFAYKELDSDEHPIVNGEIKANDFVFIALAAISDPVREDVPAAVKECLDAGIKVMIITGDNALTAREIGRQIGIWKDENNEANELTGSEVAAMTDDELKARVESILIIARARPADKERIVKALQANNEVVAVTGDGTNDAPALNAAHVGLSMGDGTSVAKEASDITIVDNSFASIGRAVLWGRSLYQNIQRFILFQMTVNVAACLVVLAGVFMGVQSPLTVTQMLWINLIMDTFAAMSLASLPPEKRLMKEKPRNRNSFIINRKMMNSILFMGGAMCLFMIGLNWFLDHTNVEFGTNWLGLHIEGYNGLSNYELSLFFTIFVFMQFWNLFNAKAFGSTDSAWKLKDCGCFKFITAIIFIGQILIIYLGGDFFNVEPLRINDLLFIIAVTSMIMIVGEIVRLIGRMRPKKR